MIQALLLDPDDLNTYYAPYTDIGGPQPAIGGAGTSNMTAAPCTSFEYASLASFPTSPTTTSPFSLEMIADFSTYTSTWLTTITNNELYEAYLDIVYNAPPVTTVTGPNGTAVTATPQITWTAIDPEGDAFERYQVKIFSDTTYLDPSFSPDTSVPAWDSGTVFSAAQSVFTGSALFNLSNYRAYVRTGSVNSYGNWGSWAYSSFSTNYPSPGTTGTNSAIPDPINACYVVKFKASGGAVSSDYFELQRSDDGGVTWAYVRNGSFISVTGGPVLITSPAPSIVAGVGKTNPVKVVTGVNMMANPSTIKAVGTVMAPVVNLESLYYDYETIPLVPVLYRARATHIIGPGQTTSSSWTTIVPTALLVASKWRLKDPTIPAMNLAIEVIPPFTFSRREPQGNFDGMGRYTGIWTSDGQKGIEGSIKIRTRTLTDYNSLWVLVGSGRALLLEDWSFGRRWYVKFGDTGTYTTIMSSPDAGSTAPVRHLHEVGYTIREVSAP